MSINEAGRKLKEELPDSIAIKEKEENDPQYSKTNIQITCQKNLEIYSSVENHMKKKKRYLTYKRIISRETKMTLLPKDMNHFRLSDLIIFLGQPYLGGYQSKAVYSSKAFIA
ncbi:hypothetical protein EDC96DRAFT_546889 [Choanephora cucurbitarum]|nr:hypothetical protein EDC96DRAFT_546889 [Choanephora cucurbitarum]